MVLFGQMQVEEAEPKVRPEALYDVLLRRILSGEYKVNERIPTQRALAQEFGCTSSALSNAMARLVHDGLVERRTRAGTRVIRNKPASETCRPQLDAVAFVYPSEQHEGIRRIVQGFQQAAHASQRRAVMLTTGTDFRKESEIVGRLDEFDVKGAVVYPVLPEPRDMLYFGQMLLKCRFPVVLTDVTLPGFGVPSVIFDGFHAGYTMTQHLLDQGIQKIGFFSSGAWVPSVRDRHQGYARAMEEAGIAPPPNGVLLESEIHPDFQNPLAEGRRLTRRFLENARELEGVVCSDDFLALACLASAKELGVRVPEQLKVTGMLDYPNAAGGEPPLTTYRVSHEEMGRQAFRILDQRLQDKALPTMEATIRGELVVRQSG